MLYLFTSAKANFDPPSKFPCFFCLTKNRRKQQSLSAPHLFRDSSVVFEVSSGISPPYFKPRNHRKKFGREFTTSSPLSEFKQHSKLSKKNFYFIYKFFFITELKNFERLFCQFGERIAELCDLLLKKNEMYLKNHVVPHIISVCTALVKVPRTSIVTHKNLIKI